MTFFIIITRNCSNILKFLCSHNKNIDKMIQKTRNQAINAFRPNTANMPISSASVIRMTFRVYWLEDFSETLELHYLRGFYFTASYFITSWYYYVVVFVIRYWMIYLPYSKREQQKKKLFMDQEFILPNYANLCYFHGFTAMVKHPPLLI